MEINPYQSPAEEWSEPATPIPPLNRLRGPTTGLILLSGMMLISCVLGALIFPFVFVLAPASPVRFERSIQEAVLCFLLLFPNAAVLYGAIQARRAKSYRWAMAAAILACIPFLSPAVFVGIPLGIWLLVVLRRQDVRACFAATSSR